MDSVGNGESSSAEALRNSMILQKIFRHCSTDSLLSSCSLVNRLWNKEARTLIREYRACTAYLPTADSCCKSRCIKIQELDELCVGMTEQGRQIPWNGLRVSTPCYQHGIPGGPGPVRLKSQLKIANLEIYWTDRVQWEAAECLFHQPLTSLFRHCASELRKLKVSDLPPEFYDGILRRSKIAGLPRLEVIEIMNSNSNLDWYPERLEEQKAGLSKILAVAPKVRRISVHELWALKIVPTDKLGMLVKMDFKFSGRPEAILYHDILNAKPALTHLSIYQPEEEYPPAHDAVEFNSSGRILAQLLQFGQHSLKQISIHGVYPIGPFTFPPIMPNLQNLAIRNQVGDKIAKDIWNTVTSMDLNQMAPRLNTVELIIRDFDPDHQDPKSRAWPSVDPDAYNLIHSCESVRELVLDVAASEIDFDSISLLFPKITSLEFRKNDSSTFSFITLPLQRVLKLWPDLRSLKITLLSEKVKARTFEIGTTEFRKVWLAP